MEFTIQIKKIHGNRISAVRCLRNGYYKNMPIHDVLVMLDSGVLRSKDEGGIWFDWQLGALERTPELSKHLELIIERVNDGCDGDDPSAKFREEWAGLMKWWSSLVLI